MLTEGFSLVCLMGNPSAAYGGNLRRCACLYPPLAAAGLTSPIEGRQGFSAVCN